MPSLFLFLLFQEPIKSRAPQLHLEYRFYKQLGNSGKPHSLSRIVCYMVYEKVPPPHPVWDWSSFSCVLRIMGAASCNLFDVAFSTISSKWQWKGGSKMGLRLSGYKVIGYPGEVQHEKMSSCLSSYLLRNEVIIDFKSVWLGCYSQPFLL